MARPQIAGRVSEASVRQAFGILYGENRRIEDVTVGNVVQWGQAKDLLKTEPFEVVAQTHSLDARTKLQGGQWPPFSSQTPDVPKPIMEAAFALRPGEVSHDPIVDGSRYHLIKLVEVIPPKVVKYDDVKADVRKQVEDQLEQSAVQDLQNQLKQVTLATLSIEDPTLKKAWDAMIDAQLPAGHTMPAKDAAAAIGRADRPAAPSPSAPSPLRPVPLRPAGPGHPARFVRGFSHRSGTDEHGSEEDLSLLICVHPCPIGG